jgi:uncharacterized protein
LARAVLRFYEELNDFLPPSRRKQAFELGFEPPAPARHLIETCGVPHTEVELILLNGVSVGLEQPVADGDRIAVYPLFEALDIRPLLRLREHPLRDPRFLADAHLGKLARLLRMLGFDVLFRNDWADRELAQVAAAEGRILLTRDRGLLMHRLVTHGCHLRTGVPMQQLRQLIQRLDLCGSIRPFSRCMECNGRLQPVALAEVAAVLPPRVREGQQRFWRCDGCGRVYWQGSHYRAMRRQVAGLCLEGRFEPGVEGMPPDTPP